MAAERSRAVDLLKLVLALMVVGIHANPFADLGRSVNLLTGEGIYRLGVPVFLVFNGYYLQGALASGRGRALLARVARLYLIWMLLYLPIYWRLAMHLSWPELLRFALFGYWHLWYLAGLTFAVAVLLALRQASDRALLALALLTWAGGVAVTWGMAADLLHPGQPFRDPLLPARNPLFLCLPYVTFGLLIARRGLVSRVPARLASAAALLGVLAVIGESFAISRMGVPTSHDALASLGLAAPALALWALALPGRTQGRLTGDLANGLYFLHVGFVALLIRHTDLHHALVWALAVAGSVALTLILRRTGLARHLF
ncbi:acyltransferase [Xinfangfangia pollutisoli]|uniref:acyltransferase n=1 Tax=Xinfangfangia pollutisoli TaxID=2865960 RepID=UPI001CD2228B|nr:acyltransferase [Xinfangfangia pollutisoli]